MSSEHPLPPDDDEAVVSRAWASTRAPQPPPALDEAVLGFARAAQQPLPRRRRRWQAPLALAAVLTLGLGVVLQLWREPQVRAPQPAAAPVAIPQPAAAERPNAAENAEVADAASVAAAADRVEQAQRQSARRSAEQESKQRDSAARREMQRKAERASRSAAEAVAAPPAPPPPPLTAAAPATPSAPASTAAITPAPQGFAPQKNATARSAPAGARLWRAPVFNGLEVGRDSRASVRVRFRPPGADMHEEPAGSGGAAAYWHGLASDVYYAAASATPNTIEFYYDAGGTLAGIHRHWDRPRELDDLLADLGWHQREAQVADAPPCGAPPSTSSDGTLPEYWVFPSQGAYLAVRPDGHVLEAFYIANCE